MDVSVAGQDDLGQLASLLWLHAVPDEQARQPIEPFRADFANWWSDHAGTHIAFVARPAESEIVGMAWLALVPRVPRPGTTTRLSADIQSVFVQLEQRGQGIGSALISAASDRARQLGAERVTVHSDRKAVPLYESLGFTSSQQLLQRSQGRP